MPSTGLALEGSGSGDAGQEIWKPAMQTYLQGKAMQSFNAPPAELVAGRSLSEWRNGLPDPDGGDPTAPQTRRGRRGRRHAERTTLSCRSILLDHRKAALPVTPTDQGTFLSRLVALPRM